MGIRIFAFLSAMAVAAALGACNASPYNARHDAGIDAISRNVNHTEGGSVRGPLQRQEPPVRRTYARDE